MNKIPNKITILLFVLAIVIIILLKQLLILNIPIIPMIGAGEDDQLMINHAISFKEGKWMGERYLYNTLMKGPMFPIYLAIINKIGLSYINTTSLLYTISCLVFMISIRKNIKSKIAFTFFFLIITFNPIMYTGEILQRVYRNSIVPFASLLVMAAYIGMFNCIEESKKEMFIWSLLGCLSLPFFYYIREDSIWIIPFIIFLTSCSIIAIVRNVIILKKVDSNNLIRLVLLIIPIISLFISSIIIGNINYQKYGYRTTNVLKKSAFVDAMKTIYSIESEVDYPYVSVTRDRMGRMAEESESFKIVKEEMDKIYDSFSKIDRNQEDDQIEDGWWFWAFRIATYRAGYNTLEKEEEIYSKISNELNEAIENGKFNKIWTMPSALMPPWRSRYFIELPTTILKSSWFVSSFNNTGFKPIEYQIVENKGKYDEIKKFENITHDISVYSNESIYDVKEELNNQENSIKKIETSMNISNAISTVYKIFSPILGALSLTGYFIFTILIIKNLTRKKYDNLKEWIISSSMLGTLIVLLAGVSYNHISSCYSLITLYLCGAYLPYLIFTVITLFFVIKIIIINRKK